MKIFKKLLTLVLACVTLVCFTACGDEPDNGGLDAGDYDLTVKYYSGAYGDEWITLAAQEFEQAKGVKVKVIPCTDMDCGAENNLTAGKNLADVYIGAAPRWQSWVRSGYLENLSSVFDAKVETSSGGVKLSEYIDQDVAPKCYAERQLGSGTMYPWVLPLSSMPMSLAYNHGALIKTPHNPAVPVSEGVVNADTNMWIAPPKTLSDWLALCNDVNANSTTIEEGHTFVPFGWTANASEQVYYFLFAWWAQYQGLYTSNVDGQGSFYDFWNFGNTASSTINQTFTSNVYNQKGIQVAIDYLRELLVDKTNEKYKNSLSAVNTLTTQELTRALYAERNEERPMIAFASSFGESEAKLTGVWDSDSDGKQDSDIRFMNIPSLDGHEGENYLYCAIEDFMFIPTKAAHKDLAKEFLIFLSSEDQCEKFSVRSMGGIRPYNYDARDVNAESYTTYNNSAFDVFYESARIYTYPLNAYRQSPYAVSLIYSYESPFAFGDLAMPTVMNLIKKNDGAYIMAEAKRTFELSASNYVKKYKMTQY